jgi:peptidoglycan/LPS O-acetylase OafA/YrhL
MMLFLLLASLIAALVAKFISDPANAAIRRRFRAAHAPTMPRAAQGAAPPPGWP